MTDDNPAKTALGTFGHYLGTTLHLLNTMTMDGRVRLRGETITVDERLIENSVNRRGDSWLDLIDDEEAQIEKYGDVKMRLGETPEGVEWWNAANDTASVTVAREHAQLRLAAISDPAERAEAAQEIRDTFGPKHTSQSLGHVPADRDPHAIRSGGGR